jgi:hypothetical protein
MKNPTRVIDFMPQGWRTSPLSPSKNSSVEFSNRIVIV